MSSTLVSPPETVDEVQRWRIQQLEDAGYPRREALLIARLPEIDLHVATQLLRDGCPLGTALRILL